MDESEPQNRSQRKKQSNIDVDFDDLELSIIVTAKKAGLSFIELNDLRVRDYVKFMEIYTGEVENKPKQATQDDIDRFLS